MPWWRAFVASGYPRRTCSKLLDESIQLFGSQAATGGTAEPRQPRRGSGDSPPRWAGLFGPPGRAFRFTAGRAGHRCGSLPERNSGSGARESSIHRSAPAQEPRAAQIPAPRKALAEPPRFCPQSHLGGRKRSDTVSPSRQPQGTGRSPQSILLTHRAGYRRL